VPVTGELDGDGSVAHRGLARVVGGPNDDGAVGTSDLLLLLANWS
jgi:hypothetical protein